MAGTSSSRSHRRLLVIGQPPMTDAEARIAAARRRQARASAAPSGTSRRSTAPTPHPLRTASRRSAEDLWAMSPRQCKILVGRSLKLHNHGAG